MSETGKSIRTFQATFNLPMKPHEIRWWRGAFTEMAGWEFDKLHNHDGGPNTHIYRYPLIQYRAYDGQAGIFAINEGIDDIQQIMAQAEWILRWKKEEAFRLKLIGLNNQEHILKIQPKLTTYRLDNWVALNQKNHQQFLKCKRLSEVSDLLERILVGQILGFCTDMKCKLPKGALEVYVQNIHRQGKENLPKSLSMDTFDISFKTNICLPDGMALGKRLALSYGILSKI